MKKSLSTILVVGMFSFLSADSNAFVGLDIGMSEFRSLNTSDQDIKVKPLTYGFKLGAEENLNRAYVSFGALKKKDDTKAYYQLLSIDRYIHKFGSDTVSFAPFFGLHVGRTSYETVDGNDKYKKSGTTYGGQLGLALDFSKVVGFDLYYRYSTIDSSYMNDLSTLSMAINFKF